MHHLVRNLLFLLFLTAFVIGAPLIVLYTAGYRYNPVNGHIVRTGVLSISSVPRGASITLSGKPSDRKTPYVFNRIVPGEYTVSLTREGYHEFVRDLGVSSGGTTYMSDIMLFLDEEPALRAALDAGLAVPSTDGRQIALIVRTERDAQVWRYDIAKNDLAMLTQYPAKPSDILSLIWSPDNTMLTLMNDAQGTEVTFTNEGVAVSPDVDDVLASPPITLTRNNQAVEVHDARQSSNPLIALLPLSDYRIAEVSGSYVVLVGSHSLHLLDLDQAKNPIIVSAEGNVYDFDATGGRLAVSDGIELTTYDLTRGTSRFLTRQSTAMIAVAWHPRSDALIVATNDDLRAFALNDDETNITDLFTDATMLSFSLDANGENGYFFGEYNGEQGVFSLPLTR